MDNQNKTEKTFRQKGQKNSRSLYALARLHANRNQKYRLAYATWFYDVNDNHDTIIVTTYRRAHTVDASKRKSLGEIRK